MEQAISWKMPQHFKLSQTSKTSTCCILLNNYFLSAPTFWMSREWFTIVLKKPILALLRGVRTLSRQPKTCKWEAAACMHAAAAAAQSKSCFLFSAVGQRSGAFLAPSRYTFSTSSTSCVLTESESNSWLCIFLIKSLSVSQLYEREAQGNNTQQQPAPRHQCARRDLWDSQRNTVRSHNFIIM